MPILTSPYGFGSQAVSQDPSRVLGRVDDDVSSHYLAWLVGVFHP
jgi:hypothetical protein